MAQLTHIQHLKSKDLNATNNGVKVPAASLFADGEIIINYNATEPTLFIRDSAGAVVEFKTADFINNLVDALRGGTLPTATGYRNVKEIAETLQTFLTSTNDADTVINKWKELEAFLNGIPDSNTTLISMMNNKVDKTTTVNGKALSANITISKADVGLGNVNNTSDAAKPISTATQNALNLKLDKTGGNISNDLIVAKTLEANLVKSKTDVIAYATSTAAASNMILDDLFDVNTTGKKDGYVFTYDEASAKWMAKQPAETGGGIKEVFFSDVKGVPADNTALNTALNTKVESAKIGSTVVTKSGTQLQLPAYPTTLPASDVSAWAKAASLAVASVPNLPSNKITALTGYSKASAVAAITTSDSLNVALGKLEKALDSKQASGNYEIAFTKNTAFNKNFGTAASTVCLGNDARLSDSRNAKDVYAWAKASVKPSYSFSEITGSVDGGTY